MHPTLRLALLAIPGVLSLALVTPPAVPGIPEAALRGAAVMNALVVLAVGLTLGHIGSLRLALPSRVAGTVSGPLLHARPLLVALLAGGGALLAHAAVVAHTAPELAAGGMPVATRLLYGGITEEIVVRWGVLGALLALALRAGAGRPASAVAAALASSLLFAVLHLPALLMPGNVPDAVIVSALVANTVAGLGFAFAFLRGNLETAMAAHAGAHLVALVAA